MNLTGKNILAAISCMILLGLTQACSSSARKLKRIEKQIDCLRTELVSNESSLQAGKFYHQLQDTFMRWIAEKRFETIVSYEKRNYFLSQWVLLSSDETDGLGFVVEIEELGEGMSSAQIITGKRDTNADVWEFEYEDSPVVYFADPSKEPGKPKKYTEEYILRGAMWMIVAVGYYSGNGCKRNEKFWQDLWTPSND